MKKASNKFGYAALFLFVLNLFSFYHGHNYLQDKLHSVQDNLIQYLKLAGLSPFWAGCLALWLVSRAKRYAKKVDRDEQN